jgi:aminoglycoside 6'-N-acetyltransferase
MRADWHFRPLLEVDLERQWRWLNEPHVNRWWSQRRLTRAEVRAKYLPRLRGEHKTICLVALFKGLPAGYVQTYRIADHADYAPGFVLPGGGWALDWFIGEPSLLGHGHGARLIDGFVSSWLWVRSGPAYAVAGSSLDNLAALKSYERANFVQWFSTLPRTTSERYYRRDRTKGEGWNAKNK